ncbi:MAG: SDR family NAD(P)-dependent oxidoreductase [Sphingomonadaceae bacterium]
MPALTPQSRLVVLGASGGIGRALAEEAEARGAAVMRLARPAIDVDEPHSFARAAEAAGDGLTHVIVATGLLHRDGRGPERDWRQIEPDWMIESFKANTVAPALAARHFLPRLATDRPAAFAVLTARVGSIADNRLGGWHSYRATKAAANQLVKTLSVELARKNPSAAIVALHPGTVDTPMSKPFQRNVPADRLFPPSVSAAHLWRVIEGLDAADSGRFIAWDGADIPW